MKYLSIFIRVALLALLPQCQWSKPDGYGKISQCITTTKHSKAKTVCIFLGIYCICATVHKTGHTMDMLWENFQWILPHYMKSIIFQSTVSDVCSVTTAVFIDFCLQKLNVFSQHIGHKTNGYLNSVGQITKNWNVNVVSVLITSSDIT